MLFLPIGLFTIPWTGIHHSQFLIRLDYFDTAEWDYFNQSTHRSFHVCGMDTLQVSTAGLTTVSHNYY
jgi:hypothetical protein